ncbi:hypothetical protein NUW58_g8793 [Xylaria curta]|uniref:Uncharacterized protein n=1 Tax=Xylaria curta TaxID=42375 RepID=A0ACC1N6G6_9PEZI|nr:hypothetical protein NUW58_g8793 [Xylaria curta]
MFICLLIAGYTGYDFLDQRPGALLPRRPIIALPAWCFPIDKTSGTRGGYGIDLPALAAPRRGGFVVPIYNSRSRRLPLLRGVSCTRQVGCFVVSKECSALLRPPLPSPAFEGYSPVFPRQHLAVAASYVPPYHDGFMCFMADQSRESRERKGGIVCRERVVGFDFELDSISTFSDLPSPLDRAFEAQGKKCNIKAVVLDKDDCFAYPDTNEVYPAYVVRALSVSRLDRLPRLIRSHVGAVFSSCAKEYPGHRLLIVSNTAGATSYDRDGRLARELEAATGVSVLPHRVKKPGCRDEIMAHFSKHPETGVTHPSEVVVIGDRLMTDMMLANTMGSWGIWIEDGVKPLSQKSIFSKFEQRLGPMLMARGLHAPDPRSPFE